MGSNYLDYVNDLYPEMKKLHESINGLQKMEIDTLHTPERRKPQTIKRKATEALQPRGTDGRFIKIKHRTKETRN